MRDEASTIGGSLRMREPVELAGSWVLKMGNASCTIILTAERIESVNGWRMVDRAKCLARVVPGAVAWRPAPEGIEIAGADRRTLLVFTATGDAPVGEAILPDGRLATLRPA